MLMADPVASATYDPELLAEVRLSLVMGIGPRLRQNLLARFGSIAAVLRADRDELCQVDRIGPKLAVEIVEAPDEAHAARQMDEAARNGIEVLTLSDSRYPRLLREIHDPPAVLYMRGELVAADQLAVAIVGTRHASRYGLKCAEELAAALARAGFTVVSGLARGIDAAAHRGALRGDGRTIAVLGGGLLELYPPEHRDLAEEVVQRGCLMSEAPPRMKPLSGSFPQRNRIISGLSLGTVVVEAADQSGALITARHAGEQGREVFAVPGPIDSRLSRGCHRLIQDRAKLVSCVDDIIEELGYLAEGIQHDKGSEIRSAAELQLSDLERQVLQAVATAPTLIDDVVAASGLPVPRVLATISVLEMRRLIRRTSGTHVVRI
jgi:DNA processing protein